jgi:hypothetical protein
MSENEDVIPLIYPYAWSPDSDLSLENFLNKVCPRQAHVFVFDYEGSERALV